MRYYCINLPGADARRAHCEQQFAEQQIAVDFYTAVDGRRLGIRHDTQSAGFTGCYLSHYTLLQNMSDEVTAVLEDDVVLAGDFKNRLETAVAELPADWQVAFIGWGHFEGWALPTLIYEAVSAQWVRMESGCLWGTHAYLVNGKAGAAAVLDSLTPIRTTVDSQLIEEILKGKLKGYFLHPQLKLAWQAGFESQINGNNE